MGEQGRKRYRSTYIEGNVVRVGQTAPAYRPQPEKTRERIAQERVQRKAATRNRKRAMAMSLGHVVFLTLATIACLVICVVFLHVQSEITTRMSQITSLETEIAEIRADNTAAEKRLETTMNLDQVKEAAAGMGLVYPESGQIFYYSVESSDYMNQYGEIPAN